MKTAMFIAALLLVPATGTAQAPAPDRPGFLTQRPVAQSPVRPRAARQAPAATPRAAAAPPSTNAYPVTILPGQSTGAARGTPASR